MALRHKKGFFIAVSLVVALLIAIHIGFSIVINNTFKWKYNVNDFEKYRASFNIVNEFVLNYSPQNSSAIQSDEKVFGLGYDSPEQNRTIYLNGTKCSLNRQNQKALNEICEYAFQSNLDSNLAWIIDVNGAVFYEIDNGQYAFVYTDDEEVLTNYYESVNHIWIKKCCDDWYHVSIDRKS